jgi:inosine-uridine nucleoside N-ribohydrolase
MSADMILDCDTGVDDSMAILFAALANSAAAPTVPITVVGLDVTRSRASGERKGK